MTLKTCLSKRAPISNNRRHVPILFIHLRIDSKHCFTVLQKNVATLIDTDDSLFKLNIWTFIGFSMLISKVIFKMVNF